MQRFGLKLRHIGLIGGLAYLLNPVTFAEFYAMPKLVADDPAQTIANITAHPMLFGAAILAYLVSLIGDVVIAWSLYYLLAPINRAVSLLAAWFQLAYAAIALAGLANLGVLYRLLFLHAYVGKLGTSALAEQAVVLVGGFRAGWLIGLVLFGIHLVLIGALIARSRYLPRWLGWLLLLDGVFWIIDSASPYVVPDVDLGILKVFTLPELIFTVWLLGWGSRLREPEPAA